MNAFDQEWENEKRRQSRIEAQQAVMPPHQRNRLERFQRETELALARVFGSRLNPDVALRIIEGLVLDPACLCTVGGGPNEMPTTRVGWDGYARELADKEPLAKLSIDAADAGLKERVRRQALNELPSVRRIAMARKGELDGYLDGVVAEELRERAGV